MSSITEIKKNEIWNTEIAGISISESSTKTNLKPEDSRYQNVANQVSLLIKTPEFQSILNSLERTRHTLRVDITGNLFKIINTANQTCIFNSSNQDTLKSGTEWNTVISTVNALATATIKQPSLLPISSEEQDEEQFYSLPNSPISLTPSSASSNIINTTYLPHPMSRDNNCCYANSAYQLLANIPSLKSSVLDALPPELNQLKDYPHMTRGKDIVEIWNKASTAQERFRVGAGHMASEFLERLVGKSLSYPETPFTTISTRNNPRNPEDREVSQTAPCAFTSLCTTDENSSIEFFSALSAGLVTHLDSNSTPDEEVVASRSYFETSPKQLFIKVDRFKDNKKDSRPINNIPQRLNSAILINPNADGKPLELKGFLVHTGNGLDSVGGHYVCYFKKADPKDSSKCAWYYANDDVIEIISEEEMSKALPCASDLYYDNELTPSPQKDSSCTIM